MGPVFTVRLPCLALQTPGPATCAANAATLPVLPLRASLLPSLLCTCAPLPPPSLTLSPLASHPSAGLSLR